MLGIVKLIKAKGIKVIVYEPVIEGGGFFHFRVINDLGVFIKLSDMVVANLHCTELEGVKNKVYTRDIFGSD